MKAPDFAYVRAESLTAAITALADAGDGGRILAGGQSLMPMLNFRAVEPDVLIDINRVPGLSDIQDQGEVLRIGALVRHSELERSDLVGRQAPLLGEAVTHVGHEAIRARGTIGGSLALADPAAELPACMLALDGVIIAQSGDGERRIPAKSFFLGAYETALGEGEIITSIEVPKPAGRRHDFREIARRHGDYALAGLVMTVAPAMLDDARIVFFGICDRPCRMLAAEDALAGIADARQAGERAVEALATIEAVDDLNASAATKRHLAGVLLRRAIGALAGARA